MQDCKARSMLYPSATKTQPTLARILQNAGHDIMPYSMWYNPKWHKCNKKQIKYARQQRDIMKMEALQYSKTCSGAGFPRPCGLWPVWRSWMWGCVEVIVMRLCVGRGYEAVCRSWLWGCVDVVVMRRLCGGRGYEAVLRSWFWGYMEVMVMRLCGCHGY